MKWSLYYDLKRYKLHPLNEFEASTIQGLGRGINVSMDHDFSKSEGVYIRNTNYLNNSGLFFMYDVKKNRLFF